MLSVYPEFYPRFSCRAGACRHSCCRGWEIDVDGESAARYRALSGALGRELREALIEDSEGWHFRLDAQERCPFLQQDGLCRLILSLGEDSLCDICALHPRFFADFGELELCGLGLSCEAAAALLLEGEGPLRFVCAGRLLTLPQLLAESGLELPEEALTFVPCLERETYDALLRTLGETEPIDENWPREIAALREELDARLERARDYALRCDRQRYTRILSYILYRQLDRLGERSLTALLRYARESTAFLFLLDAGEEDTAEHLRRWSEQIEYSTENVDRLLARHNAAENF